MLINTQQINALQTDSATFECTPVAPVQSAVPAVTAVRPMCTTDHRTIASANASWLYEQKPFGNHATAMKRHSQRERPT